MITILLPLLPLPLSLLSPSPVPCPLSLPPFLSPSNALEAEVRGCSPRKIFEILRWCRWVLVHFEICNIDFLSTVSVGLRIMKNKRPIHLGKMPEVGGQLDRVGGFSPTYLTCEKLLWAVMKDISCSTHNTDLPQQTPTKPTASTKWGNTSLHTIAAYIKNNACEKIQHSKHPMRL